jgi:hypothetical protein
VPIVTVTPSAAPAGFEVGYTQITAPVNVTDTAEATATAIITVTATFDGAAVYAEFFAPSIVMDTAAVTDLLTVTLFEAATQITRLQQVRSAVTTTTNIEVGWGRHKFTPTAAAHTYKLCAFVTSTTGTPQIVAGAGGTGAFSPAYLRFVKA